MEANRPPHIMIVAGEASGDMHAAHLVEEIHKLNPAVTFSGLGGAVMESKGVVLYEDFTRLAVVGFVEVLKHYGEFHRIFHSFLKKAAEIRPDAVILVDYPGFNLRLAKKLKGLGLKVIYYISPQVWAWKENRVELIRKVVDKMMVLFEFEKDFYAKRNLGVAFVGHPLVDLIDAQIDREKLQQSFPFNSSAATQSPLTIGILPGSRLKEIQTLLPPMLDAAQRIKKEVPAVRFLLLKAPTISKELLDQFTSAVPLPLTIVSENIYEGITRCDLCLVASGTATLEVAILNKPMIIVYKTSWVTWLLAKMVIKIPYIGLVNIVAGRRIIPECIQHEANGKKIADELLAIQRDPVRQANIKAELEKVRLSLGSGGAGERAAKEVLKTI